MRKVELKIEYVGIDEITPYLKNARKHQKADVKSIEESIKDFGMCDPIGVWNNTIVEGHGRLLALKKLGYKEVPIIRLDHLSDEERRAYALAHNKTAENSEWDFELLPDELNNILNIDMSKFGFDFVEEEKEIVEVQDIEELEDVEKLEKHYGVPYQGNKSRIADKIVEVLPDGKRLVDLFGGGWSNNTLCYAPRKMAKLFVQ